MFGTTVRISMSGLTLVLRQTRESDIANMTMGMSDWQVRKYLGAIGGVTEQNEREWIQRTSQARDSLLWVIQPEGVEYAIGSTALHGIDNIYNSCSSGFVIWDKSWWKRGVASLAHIARTWFAARQLNRFTIVSSVYAPNYGSWKALEKVGYIRTGSELRSKLVDGEYVDKYIYTWLNPFAQSMLYPEGFPEEYAVGIQKAKQTILKGDEIIEYI